VFGGGNLCGFPSKQPDALTQRFGCRGEMQLSHYLVQRVYLIGLEPYLRDL
jgi:hypothetical protein